MAKSKTKSTPKPKKGKWAKPAHPFSSATVENSFYFVRTAPRLYSAVDYFETFNPKTSDRRRLHSHWTNALQILLDSPEQQYVDQGKRLKLCWKSPGNGLGAFWLEREDDETASDIEDAIRNNIRKHSLRSAERNVLGAIHNLDDQSRSKRKRRERKALGKENTDPEQITMENGQGSHANSPYTKSRNGNDNDTQDVEAGSPEAFDANRVLDGHESQALESNVCRAPMDAAQEASDTVQVSEGDDTGPDVRDDDLISQKSTASECERSRSLSRGIYYLTGDGSTDCSKALWTPWPVNGQDLAPTLWKYRKGVIDAAQRVALLTSSVERLAVNHIYLFERNDITSSLYVAVGAEDWITITSGHIQQGMDDAALTQLLKLALEIGNLSHAQAEERVLDWTGAHDIKKSLAGLVADDFLWTTPPFNEHELLIHVFDPLIKAYVCSVKTSTGRWDKVFPPSEKRRKGLEVDSRGRRPDFALQSSLRGKTCRLFFMEAKRERQGSAVQVDLEKTAMMMKDAIDDMSSQGLDVSKIEVIGLVIVGTEGRLYTMCLEARGIYVMRFLTVIYAPRSRYDFSVLASTINTLIHVHDRLEQTLADISSSQATGVDLTRPGFLTPTRVFIA
ncbi:MAG: hypothetical protein BYD32DRAFT_414597 [Podila humilis]|nr:MAG: hypothetical protein BYD32DRAFT_414597 [Podila humilis]